MQARAWTAGMTALVLAFPSREQTETVQEARGRLYQQHLADLTDEQWGHAVRESICRDRFFPTIAELRNYAASAAPGPEHWDPGRGRVVVETALATVERRPGEDLRMFFVRLGEAAARP